MTKVDNVLTEDFLYELYYACFSYDNVCSLVCTYMRETYLPGRDFQNLQKLIDKYYEDHKSAPTLNIISQIASTNREVSSLLSDIKDCAEGTDPDVILEQFEDYLKQVKFQKTYKEIGDLYSKNERVQAMQKLQEFAEWQTEFSLTQDDFLDVVETFESRFKRNREQHNLEEKVKPITRFYIDDLDERNQGRELRTQLTCFLASTGVGKSHVARWIGKCAAQVDGLNVLHIQLEGSKSEVADAYSASLVSCNIYRYTSGTLRDTDLEKMVQMLQAVSGTIKIKSYPKFANQVSTMDIKNCIAKYKKRYGVAPDVVIIDSMDLLTDSSGKQWNADATRHKRVAVANDLKDLAAEENVWMVVTYQATIENPDWINDENNVLTEYNCAEAKGLARPLSHLITLNQSANEAKENTMRINVAKSRFFKKGSFFKIATDYEHENFYDRGRTMNLKKII